MNMLSQLPKIEMVFFLFINHLHLQNLGCYAAFSGIRVLPCGERLLPQPRLHPLVQEPRLVRGHSPPATDPPRILQLQHLQPD